MDTENVVCCATAEDRECTIGKLTEKGYNHFVVYRDSSDLFPLKYEKIEWLEEGIAVDRW